MYTKEGPGVRKDEPKKKGFARFFEILLRDYGHLLKANFFFMMCCAPLILVVVVAVTFTAVTGLYLGVLLIAAALYVAASLLVGPALASLHAIAVKTVRDEPCYMWHEFKRVWKANWRQSMPAGTLFCTLLAMEGVAAYFYLFSQEKTNVLLTAFVLFGLLLVTVCWLFTTLQLLFLDMPLLGMMKNSLLIMFGYAKRALPAGLIILAATVGVVFFVPWPIVIPIMFLGLPALLAVIGDMWAWPVMETAFHISELQQAKRDGQGGESAQ